MKTRREPSTYVGGSLSTTDVNSQKQGDIVIETLDTSLNVTSQENLLDALLASGHEIDYQCRGGYCGSCRIKVISGQVTYDEYPLAHLDGDEILPCCCRVIDALKLSVSLR